MEVIELHGTPKRMGEAFGASYREAIRSFYALRLNNAIEQAIAYGKRTVGEAWLLSFAEDCLPLVRSYHPAGYEELEGIAEGSGLELRQVWMMNALTDVRDVAAFGTAGRIEAEGCSSLVAHGTATRSGRALVGQTWDLATDNMPYVRVVHRRPAQGPETVSLTTVGCLSLIGLSAVGLAVGTTNLQTTDAQAGVGYLDVIHRALSCSSFASARSAILAARRAGGHYFYLADGEGPISTFEGAADWLVERPVRDGFRVQCNHALAPEIARLEPKGMPGASTHHRQQRLTDLAEAARPLGAEDLRRFFADRNGGPLAINRKDFGGISTNGSVVMDPASKRFWAVHGPADTGTWIERQL